MNVTTFIENDMCEQAQRFCQKMKWKTHNETFGQMTSFKVDCFMIRFKRPLTKDEMYDLFDFMDDLDFTKGASIINTLIYLYQQHIEFTLKYAYNRQVPLKVCLKQIGIPQKIDKYLKHHMTAVMSYDLSQLNKKG